MNQKLLITIISLLFSNAILAQLKPSNKEIQALIDKDFVFMEVDTPANMIYNNYGCYIHNSLDTIYNGKYHIKLTIVKTGVLSKIEINNERNMIVKDSVIIKFFKNIFYNEYTYYPAILLSQKVSSILKITIEIKKDDDDYED